MKNLFRNRTCNVVSVVLALIGWLGFSSPARAQSLSDLLGNGNGSTVQTTSSGDADLHFGRDRVDLGLSPNMVPLINSGQKYVGLSAGVDLRMICGQYDLKASLQHLLGREAREEFLEGILGTLVQTIVGGGMDLLCQAEPTVCTILQHHNISANLKLGYYSNLCQAVESAVVDAAKKNAASTVDQCLKDKQNAGLSLDQAVDQCGKKPTQLTGFRGQTLAELDLGKELGDLLSSMGVSTGAQKIATQVSDQTTLSSGQVGAQLDPNSVSRLYDQSQADYANKLNTLLNQAASLQPVATVDLRALIPAGAPPVTDDEIRDYSRLPARERAAVVAALSSAWAILDLGNQIRELERAIEVVQGAPTVDEQNRKLLGDRLSRLRNEKARLIERFRDQEIVAQAMVTAKGVSGQEYAKQVGAFQDKAGEQVRKRELLNDTRSFGTLPNTSVSTPPSSGCAGCGMDFSLGSLGTSK